MRKKLRTTLESFRNNPELIYILKNYGQGLLRFIELAINIIKVNRISTSIHNNGNAILYTEQRPKTHIVTNRSKTQRDSVLKNQLKLNKITVYKNNYIERDRSGMLQW